MGFDIKEVRYYESDIAFLRRVLGNRKGRSSAILVMNDEHTTPIGAANSMLTTPLPSMRKPPR